MLISAFGAPTPYCNWAMSILEHVLDTIYGSHYRIHCDTVAELREAWRDRNGRPVLVTSNMPDRELSDFLVASGFPCLAFVDDPVSTIVAPCEDVGFHDGVRLAVSHIAVLHHCLAAKQVRCLGSDFRDASLPAFIVEILILVTGEADSDTVIKIALALAPDAPTSTVEHLVRQHSGRDISLVQALEARPPNEQALARALADAYAPLLARQPLTFLEWPLELFTILGSGLVVDLVGKGRCVIWGPYLYLPAGRWRATVECEVVDNISGNEIEADICIALEVSANGRAYLPALGLFAFSLEFDVVDPSRRIELRLHLLKGAIEGRLGLRRVTVERVDASKTKTVSGEPIEARALV